MAETADIPTIERISAAAQLHALRDEWDGLSRRGVDATVFSSYAFVATAWEHFSGPADELCILVVRRGGAARAIAPLYVHTAQTGPVRCRLIRFIAQWGNGDRPHILTDGPEDIAWKAVARYLENEYTHWDGIEAAEQRTDSPLADQRMLTGSGRYSLRTYAAHPAYFASLRGTWEEFERDLKPKVRQNLNTRMRGINALPHAPSFECMEEARSMPAALARFVAIENTGWKKGASFGMGGDARAKCFYENLIARLAERGMAAFYFLKTGATDIASSLIFKCGTTISSINTVYDPAYARYAPGVLLRAEILRRHLGSPYATYDYLGCPSTDLQQSAKKDWSTGSVERRHVHIYKNNIRAFVYRAGLRLAAVKSRGPAARENHKPEPGRSIFFRIRRKLLRDRTAYLMYADIAAGVRTCAPLVPLDIRPMSAADIPRMAALLDEGDADTFRARLEKGKLGFVAECAGAIAHYSWISMESEYETWSGVPVTLGEHEAYAYTGFTAPDFRGKRIYPAVLAHEMEYLRQQGIKRVWIVIGTGNAPSLAAARRAGFRPARKYVNLRIAGIRVAYCRKVGEEPKHS